MPTFRSRRSARVTLPGQSPCGHYLQSSKRSFGQLEVGNTTSWFSEGISSYNGLEVDVSHRLSHGLQFRGVYTFSKSLDDGDNMNTSIATNSPAFTMNPLQPNGTWPRIFRHPALAVINAIYDLPFGRNNASGIHPFLTD